MRRLFSWKQGNQNESSDYNRKKSDRYIIFSSIILIFCITGFIYINIAKEFNSLQILNLAATDEQKNTREAQALVNKKYDRNYMYTKKNLEKKGIYFPVYKPTEPETARIYGGCFGFEDFTGEDEDNFYFINEKYSVIADKRLSVFEFSMKNDYTENDESIQFDDNEITNTKTNNIKINNKETAYDYLLDIMNKYNLARFVPHSTYSINYSDGIYSVYFMNKLEDMEDYAFRSYAKINENGDIGSFVIYCFDYEKISAANVKQEKEAYYELPTDTTDRIDLKLCRLVYVYGQGIVQPAYLFEGETMNGETFQCFVYAVRYE